MPPPNPALLRTPCSGCDDGGDGDDEESGQDQERGRQGGGGGEGADQQGSASIAEFAADFGGAEGLAEPFFWGGDGEVGEPDRRDDADTAANEERGRHQPDDAGYRRGRTAERGERESDGQ